MYFRGNGTFMMTFNQRQHARAPSLTGALCEKLDTVQFLPSAV